jgi:hypothetical protein
MEQVVDKLVAEEVKGILIAPHWTNLPWWSKLQTIIRRRHFYRVGVRVFETESGDAGPTKWPVWALLVDGALSRPQDDLRSRTRLRRDTSPEVERTKAARRRWRRDQRTRGQG